MTTANDYRYASHVHYLLDPLSLGFFTNALTGGVLAALVCSVAGTWVVIRGMGFLGEAIGHGMLPGVAISALIGLPTLVGAALSATAMGVLVALLSRRARLSQDTAIGITFVLMLSLGVIIVSRSRSFATDITAILFGDILGIRSDEITVLIGTLIVVLIVGAVMIRPLTALSLDPGIALTLGMRPALAQAGLTLLIIAAVVASYRAVGTLLVVALLVAPPATASLWSKSILAMTAWAAVISSACVVVGLYISLYADTAGGATITATAAGVFLLASGAAALTSARRRPNRPLPCPATTKEHA
ncbi:zinc/manganese transport system permease protein/manganese/iron transport system permease protein [Actinomyces denticolens]|uniref:Zinc/manganese transport system permease protein/manganese/iron transport system permease protein n=1 Tax=Actinomyces denticolens TaxID=52767 RepID=A0ABY1HXU7_9ACTO|nr:zinc ABC transporter permease AztB [Actinomyces denticolens]SHI28662.1 zinc/manganese transport system permease protein/manganese/iron transport system permease protein [Actinomyces denticolens]